THDHGAPEQRKLEKRERVAVFGGGCAAPRIEAPVQCEYRSWNENERCENQVAVAVPEIIDRVSGDHGTHEMSCGITEPQRCEIVLAFLRRAKRATERLIRDVEENETGADENAGKVERRLGRTDER